MRPSQKQLGLAYLALTVILFSTFEVTSKFLAPALAPTQITFIRFLVGGLVLLPFALYRLRRKGLRLGAADWLACAVLGLVNIVLAMGLIQLGLVYADASICAVLFSLNPLFVLVFARWLLGERLTPPKLAGLGLGLAGMGLLLADSLGRRSATPLGLALILASAVFFALYTVLGKRIVTPRLDSVVVTALSFLLGSLMMAPLQLALGVPLLPDVSRVVWPLLYMSVMVTGVAYAAYFAGLSRLEAGAGSLLYFAKPALASILAVLLLGERPGPGLAAGVLVVAAGIVVANFRRPGLRRAEAAPPRPRG